MNKLTVFVLTNSELGWDCVLGVFLSIEAIQLWFLENREGYLPHGVEPKPLSYWKERCYVITEEEVES